MPDRSDTISNQFAGYIVEDAEGRVAIDVEAIATQLVLAMKVGVAHGNYVDQEAYIITHDLVDHLWFRLAATVLFEKGKLQ